MPTPADIHRERTRRGLSRSALGAELGVTRNTVYRWEVGASPVPAMLEFWLRSSRRKPGK